MHRALHTIRVNGTEHRVAAAPDTPLLLVLRNDLGLTSPKYGCGAEQCGACMVLIDGQPAPTCRLPVRAAAGRAITTVEGLAPGAGLHPIQQAFIEHNAIQCGYCAGGGDDRRRRPAGTRTIPDPGANPGRARSQHLPLRRPQPDDPRHATGRRGGG